MCIRDRRYAVIAFGDNDDNNAGEIYYDHTNNDMNFRVNGNVRWAVGDSIATLSHGQLSLGGTGRIQGIDTVTASTDAASKGYVDGLASNYAAASHNHDDRYYTETESRNKFTTTDATEHDYTFTLDDESNFSGNRWYHLATLNSQNGGLHIRGAILNHVENFASQKIDIAIQVREANDGGQLEITGSLDVLHNATSGTDRAGIRVIKSAESGTYDEFKVYLRVTRYQQVTLRMTEQGTTAFNTNHSSPATTEPAPVSGGHVELDTSSTVEGNYVIDNSTIKEIYHEGHLPTYSELGNMAYSNLTGTPTIPTNSTFVDLSNAQTIGGLKTFSAAPVLAGTSANEGGEIKFGAPTTNGAAFHLDNHSGNLRVHTLETGKYFQIIGADGSGTKLYANHIRSSSFYDADDTTYYLDNTATGAVSYTHLTLPTKA